MAALDILKKLLGDRLSQNDPPIAAAPSDPIHGNAGAMEKYDQPGMAARPRVVPGQPVTDATPYRPLADEQRMMTEAPMVQDTMAAQPTLQSRISAIDNKDYSPGGADRDKKWSVKDKIGSTLMGILEGARGGPLGMISGGINAGMDRNYLEKRDDRKELGQMVPALQRQQGIQKNDLDLQQQQLQNDYLAVKPTIEQQKVDTAATAAQSKQSYYEGLLEIRKQGNNLRAEQIEDLRDYRKELLRQGDANSLLKARQIEETIRNNKATEEGRNSRASLVSQDKATQREFTAGQKEIERKMKAAVLEYNRATGLEKQAAMEQMRAIREEARKAGID